MDAPNPALDAGVTDFFGHVFTAGKIKFQAGPVPLEIDGDTVINIDADRDGQILGGVFGGEALISLLDGDLLEAIAEATANVNITFDGDRPRWHGSVTATGRLRYKGDDLFEGALEALVRNRGFRFRFPRGVGSLDFDIRRPRKPRWEQSAPSHPYAICNFQFTIFNLQSCSRAHRR
jgi:hypothetical protein